MKYLSLIFGILCFINFLFTFFTNVETEEFLSLKINIWLYRLIYLIISIILFYRYKNK